jgi:hypothetical protein
VPADSPPESLPAIIFQYLFTVLLLRASHRKARCRTDHLLRVAGVFTLAALTMTCQTTLAAGITRFFARPLVRGAFLMRCLATLAGNLALSHSIHRRKTTIFFCHSRPP